MKKRNILVVAKNIDGGTGTYVESLSKIRSNNTSVSIFSLESPVYRKLSTKITTYRNPHKTHKHKLSLHSLVHTLKDYLWIKKNISSISPTTIISVGNYCNVLIYFASKNINSNIILTVHNNIQSTLKEKSSALIKFLLTRIMAKVYNHPNQVVCVSNGVADNLKKIAHLNYQPTTIYNGITPINITPHKIPSKQIILNISRFDGQKDHISLLKAFQISNTKFPKSQLWLLGDGPTKSIIQNYAKKNAIPNVSFFGWKTRTKKYLSKATIFVHSSHRDGLPYSILEAISYGVPTISTDSKYGPREILGKNEFGLLVPPKNPDKLAQAITFLLKDDKNLTLYSRQAKIRSNYFTEEKMLNNYKKILK